MVNLERTEIANLDFQKKVSEIQEQDPFDDDTPLVCGVENPEYCATCQ